MAREWRNTARSSRPSPLEAAVELQLRALKLPPGWRQYKPLPDRKFALDFAWPEYKLAVEVDGMVHRIKERFEADAERHNLLLDAGWRVYRVTGKMVRSGAAADLLLRLLASLPASTTAPKP